MKLTGFKSEGVAIRPGKDQSVPPVSFYSLKASLANGEPFDFSHLRNKKILLVNVASNCGFTPQYSELEKLNTLYQSGVTVLGFPANDFKDQEPGTDKEIENFCKRDYKVSFPIFSKASVLKPGQQEVFQWLTDKEKNGWNDDEPSWNFCKYLINETGQLMAIFKSHVSPLDAAVINLIQKPSL